MKESLPVIESCNGCGACCLEQRSPPGYAMLLSSEEMMDNAELLAEDVDRLRNLPKEPMAELRRYLDLLLARKWPEDPACIWLDRNTMKCRFHEHRPSICREFEIGSEDCLGWREQYDVQNFEYQ